MANVQLANVNGTLLPPTITGPIFKKTAEVSAVQNLARRIPLAVNAQTAIPVPMDIPTADWVVEGGSKPTGSAAMGIKIMTGKKLAVLVPVSTEIAMTNAAGLYDQLEQDLPTALSRAFDYAAIHGLSLKTGSTGPFTDYLVKTPNSQVIGATASNAGGAYTDLWKGVSQVVNASTSGFTFNGFAGDPRLIPELAMSTDANGRPLFIGDAMNANTGVDAGRLINYPAYFNNGVSGKYNRGGNAVQVITITGSPTGGTFTLTVGGQSTTAIAYNATAATVQTALQALTGGYAGAPATNPYGATVTGSGGGPYTVTFAGAAGPISVASALTGGSSPAVTITQSPAADSGLRAIGGDWTQAAWGQGMDITIKVSTEANYYDGTNWHSAFQENLVLLLAECYYGFVTGPDPTAFVAYTHAAGS